MNSLVTVVVVTYNSSPFIVETLESVLNQSWKEIELIITDDCSRDDTVEVCRKWLKENKQRFTSAEIITSDKNTGVPANANRGLFSAKGDWMNFLAGDDTMTANCLEDNMVWITSHQEIKVLFSFIQVFNKTFEFQNLVGTIPHGDPYHSGGIMAPGRSAESQYKMLLLCDRIHFTPSLFLHRKTMIDIGGFDERFKLLEDHPLWLNLTRNGYRLHFMDKVTVNYRQHPAAINNMQIEYLIKPNYFRSENFRKIYTYPNLPADIRLSQRFIWFVSQLFRVNWLNRNNKPNRFLLSLLTIYLNPFRYYIWLKRHLNKNLKDNEFYT
jgi:glycosyltransferase involved in cell wall biosynthesis